MYCLIDYDRGCNIRTNPKRYSPGNTASNLVAAYGDYYDFLKEIAASLVNEPGLMPLEKFLVDYYADPRKISWHVCGQKTWMALSSRKFTRNTMRFLAYNWP